MVSMQTHGKKIIAITGATGAQGGSLARSILADPDGEFSVRAITRNSRSPAALALRDAGAEVVQADLDERSSLQRAFTGAYGAFFLTNYWEHLSPQTEQAQAENLARAAGAAGIRHGVWSTLEDTRRWLDVSDTRMPILDGQYNVPHMDSKGDADRFFLDAGVPTSFVIGSFYWENMVHLGLGPQRTADGSLALLLPLGESALPGIAVDDIGPAVHTIFRLGAPAISERFGIAGEHLTGAEMAARLGHALGETVTYAGISADVFRGFGFPGADDMGNMFQFVDEFSAENRALRPVEATRRLNPDLRSFATWLSENSERIPR